MMDNNNDLLEILEGRAPAASTPVVETPTAQDTPPTPATEAVDTPAPNTDTPTPNTPAANTPAPVINLDAELEKISGGRIKTAAELTELQTKLDAYTDLESRLKTAEEERNSFKSKAETDPFASDYYKKLNQLAKDGATPEQLNAFSKVNQVGDLSKMPDIEAKVLALQLRDGLTEDEARSYVNRTFKLDPSVFDEQEVADAKIDLKLSAKTDRAFLNEQKTELEVSPLAAQQRQAEIQQQRVEQHIERVIPIANSVVATAKDMFKGVSINGKTGEGAITIDLVPTDESLASVKEYVTTYLRNKGEQLPATEAGKAEIATYVKNLLILQNHDNWRVEAASAREKQVRAEYHNPTPVNRGIDHPNPGKASQDEVNQRLIDLYN